MWRKIRPKLLVLQLWKKLKLLEKKFFRKKIPAYLCKYMIFKTLCGMVLSRVVLRFRKMVFHNKIINKTRSTKNQENPAYRFVDNYLSNHHAKFCKIGLNPEELELLEYALVITFSKRKSLVKSSSSLWLFVQFMLTIFIKATSKTSTRTLDLDPEKPGLWKF